VPSILADGDYDQPATALSGSGVSEALMTLYPHEWLWQKLKNHIDLIGIFCGVATTALVAGCVTFWYAINYPQTNAWATVNVVQPSAYSYAPIISAIAVLFFVLACMTYHHRGDQQ
jgi:hypothetical protein